MYFLCYEILHFYIHTEGEKQGVACCLVDADYDDFVVALRDSVGSIPCSFGLYNVEEDGQPGPFIFLSW